MRLKIKQVQPSPDIQNQEVRIDLDSMKKEVEEEEEKENGCGWIIPDENNSNESPADLSPTTFSVPLNLVWSLLSTNFASVLLYRPLFLCRFAELLSDLVNYGQGKRKRKPKELIDEVSPIIIRRKRKKPTNYKIDQVKMQPFFVFFFPLLFLTF